MTRTNPLLFTVLTTAILWLGALLVYLFSPVEELMVFALVVAFGGTAALWLVWTFASYDREKASREAEKAKRSADRPAEARLALLLELMGEDDRRALQRRLRDEIGTDGEAVSLAELLAAQEDDARRSAS